MTTQARTRRAALQGLAALLTGCTAGRAPEPAAGRREPAAAAYAARVERRRLALQIPGLALVVLNGPHVLQARGFGLADVETGRAVTPDTPFDIASVSKPFAGVVAMRLVEQGLLDLDTPMQRFAGFADFCAAVRAEGGVFFRDYACAGDAMTLRHVLSMTANGERPGDHFWYNPPSFSWASRPLAEAGGRPYSTLVDELVFQPAGMQRSARRHRGLPLPADLQTALARPYDVGSDGRPRPCGPPPPQGDGAAGGVIASAMDLARFDTALDDGRLLQPASRSAMWTPAHDAHGRSVPYGVGWFIAEQAGRQLVWHTGLWEGRYSALYLKLLARDAADRYTLILLANSDGLRWPSRLDEAAIERSPFARDFLATFGSP